MAKLRQANPDGHAIISAAFAVQFASPVAPPTIRELLALHSKFEASYPRKRETTGRVVGVQAGASGAGVSLAAVGEPTLTGFIFDSLEPDGQVKRSVTLDEEKLSIMRNDYATWKLTWGEVRNDFALMLPSLLHRSDVMAFHLQFHDRFIWEGEPKDFSSENAFRRETELLAPNVFRVPELWHSYHGFFEYPDSPNKHQLLNVVEVQLLPAQDEGLSIEIKLSHRIHPGVERAGGIGKPLTKEADVLGGGDGNGLIDTYMNEMHDKNNWLLARLINDDMCERINLDRPV